MRISDLMQKDLPNNPETNARNEARAQSMESVEGPKPQEDVSALPPSSPQAAEPDSDVPTPEEQQQYDRLVTAGIKVLTEATDQVLQMLEAGSDSPPQALADTTWTIMTALDEKAGGNIEVGILVAAGAEVMENVGQFAAKAQLFPVDERILNQGWQIIMQRLSDEYGIDWGEEVGADIQSMDPNQLQKIVSQQQEYFGS